MKPTLRKTVAAEIRAHIASSPETPIGDDRNRGRYTHRESDIIVTLAGKTCLRIRNHPGNLEAVARNVERGEPWFAANGGAFRPSVPTMEQITSLYGSPHKAEAKIREHLDIQRDYMEPGQVKACEAMLSQLAQEVRRKSRRLDLRKLEKTLPTDLVAAANEWVHMKSWTGRLSKHAKGRKEAAREAFRLALVEYAAGDLQAATDAAEALGASTWDFSPGWMNTAA